MKLLGSTWERGIPIVLQVFPTGTPPGSYIEGRGNLEKALTMVLVGWGKQYPLWNPPRPLSFIPQYRTSLNQQWEGLKNHGLRTLVFSLQQGKRNRGKIKRSSTPGRGAGNPVKDKLKTQYLSLRLNQVIKELPPLPPATTWQNSFMVSNSGIQLGGL